MGSAPQIAPRTVNITVSSKPITQMFDGSLIPVDAVRGFSDNCLPHRSNAMSRLQIAAATKQTIRTPANTGGVAIDIRKNKPKSALFTLIIRSCLVNSMGDRARCIHQFACAVSAHGAVHQRTRERCISALVGFHQSFASKQNARSQKRSTRRSTGRGALGAFPVAWRTG